MFQEVSGGFHGVSEAFLECSRGSGHSMRLQGISSVSWVYREVSEGFVGVQWRRVSKVFQEASGVKSVPEVFQEVSRGFMGI